MKLEFPEGWGGEVQTKKPSVGGVWIFSGTTQLKGRGHNPFMSNFGPYFICAQICLIFCHVCFKLIGKQLFSVFFPPVFSSFSRNNVCKKKNLRFLVAFFSILLLKEKQRKPFASPTVFACYFSKTKRKPVGKNKEKCLINL